MSKAHLPDDGPTARELVIACRRQGLFLRDAAAMGSNLGQRPTGDPRCGQGRPDQCPNDRDSVAEPGGNVIASRQRNDDSRVSLSVPRRVRRNAEKSTSRPE